MLAALERFRSVCSGGQLVSLYALEAQTEEDRRCFGRPSLALKPNREVIRNLTGKPQVDHLQGLTTTTNPSTLLSALPHGRQLMRGRPEVDAASDAHVAVRRGRHARRTKR